MPPKRKSAGTSGGAKKLKSEEGAVVRAEEKEAEPAPKAKAAKVAEEFTCVKSGVHSQITDGTAFGRYLRGRLAFLSRFVTQLAPQMTRALQLFVLERLDLAPTTVPLCTQATFAQPVQLVAQVARTLNLLKLTDDEFAEARSDPGHSPFLWQCVRIVRKMRPNTYEQLPHAFTTRVLEELTKQYRVMCRNYASSQYLRLVRRHIGYFLRAELNMTARAKLDQKRVTAIFDALFQIKCKRVKDEKAAAPSEAKNAAMSSEAKKASAPSDAKKAAVTPEAKKAAVLTAAESEWVATYRSYLPACVLGLTFPVLSGRMAKDTWWNLMPLLAAFQRDYSGKKKFSLFPQYGTQPHHAILGRTGMVECLFKHYCSQAKDAPALRATKPLEAFQELVPLWEQAFLRRAHTKNKGIHAVRRILSDGVSLVLCFAKGAKRATEDGLPGPGPQPKDTHATFSSKVARMQTQLEQAPEHVRVIGVDPGITSVFTTAEIELRGKDGAALNA